MFNKKVKLFAVVFLFATILCVTSLCAAEERNLIPNGSFEFWTSVNGDFIKDARLGFQ